MLPKSQKQIKFELKRVRNRQNPHIFNNKDYKRKITLKISLWRILKQKIK